MDHRAIRMRLLGSSASGTSNSAVRRCSPRGNHCLGRERLRRRGRSCRTRTHVRRDPDV